MKTVKYNLIFLLLFLLSGCGASSVDKARTAAQDANSILVNKTPVADAGLNQTVKLKEVVILSALKSTDSDGNIVSYKWSEGGTALGQSKTLVINTLSLGTHIITLSVTDNSGATSSDIVTIIVVKNSSVSNNTTTTNTNDYLVWDNTNWDSSKWQ